MTAFILIRAPSIPCLGRVHSCQISDPPQLQLSSESHELGPFCGPEFKVGTVCLNGTCKFA
jgi:hypothetical protein